MHSSPYLSGKILSACWGELRSTLGTEELSHGRRFFEVLAVVVEMLTQAQVRPCSGGSFPSQVGLLHVPVQRSISWQCAALGIARSTEVPLDCQPRLLWPEQGCSDVSVPASFSPPLQPLVFISTCPIKAKCNASPTASPCSWGCAHPTLRCWPGVGGLTPAILPKSHGSHCAMINVWSPALHPVTREGGQGAKGDCICQQWQK